MKHPYNKRMKSKGWTENIDISSHSPISTVFSVRCTLFSRNETWYDSEHNFVLVSLNFKIIVKRPYDTE